MRSHLGIREDAPVILFVGSGFERKGVPALLTAMSRMERKDAELLIVGRDRMDKEMCQLAGALGIAERVRFLGSQKDVRPYYGAADGFALPTLYDPMPNAALEALACGLPVVTSTSCGAAELIVPQVNGFVCDALEIDELARKLDALCGLGTSPEEVQATVSHLGIDDMAAKLIEIYGTTAG
jgi:UDP-glucose:(heptosyl)LPS alpha-1,3-glucosyltransferase